MSGAHILHPRGAGCTATEDLALHRGELKFVKCMSTMMISHPPSVDYANLTDHTSYFKWCSVPFIVVLNVKGWFRSYGINMDNRMVNVRNLYVSSEAFELLILNFDILRTGAVVVSLELWHQWIDSGRYSDVLDMCIYKLVLYLFLFSEVHNIRLGVPVYSPPPHHHQHLYPHLLLP